MKETAMMIKRLMPLVAVAGLIGCEASVVPTSQGDPPAFRVFQGDVASYILVAASANSLPRNLDRLVGAHDGVVRSLIPQIGVAVVESSNPDFISDMESTRGIQAVFPDLLLVQAPGGAISDVETDTHNSIPAPVGTSLDGLLWGLDAVDAPAAWADGVKGAGVRIAILDAGIDETHPDLAPNLNSSLSASFSPCLPFFGNCDGAVEDWKVRPGLFFNHGTHVSGTVAADDNGTGVTGVAPDAELVAVKVCTEFFNACFQSAILAGIVYAADIDADLINMSLGGLNHLGSDWWMPFCREVLGLSQRECGRLARFVVTFQDEDIRLGILPFKRAFQYAYNQGTTVIVSAGNAAIDADRSKDEWLVFADFPHVIGVSALGPVGWCLDPSVSLDELAFYSNLGRSVIDVAAPGGNARVIPPLLDPCTKEGVTRRALVFDAVLSSISEGWDWAQGTSMAAPHATGIAALIIGENGGNMRPSEVERRLKALADDLGTPGTDEVYGAGRVNSGH